MAVEEGIKPQNWCDLMIVVTKYSKFGSGTSTVWLFLSCCISLNIFCNCIKFTWVSALGHPCFDYVHYSFLAIRMSWCAFSKKLGCGSGGGTYIPKS